MAHKKGKKQKRITNPLIANAVGTTNEREAQTRVNKVITQALTPPESVLAHIERVGGKFWVAPFGVNEDGTPHNQPCVVVPFNELVKAEMEYLNRDKPDASRRTQEALKLFEDKLREAADKNPDAVKKIQEGIEKIEHYEIRNGSGEVLSVHMQTEDEDEYDLGKIQG